MGKISASIRPWILTATSICFGYLLVRFLLDGVVAVGSTPLTPSAGLAIPLGIFFGIPAAAGIAAGALVVGIFHAGMPLWTLFEALSLFLLAVVSWRGWTLYFSSLDEQLTGLSGWVHFARLTVVGSVGAAAFLAWGGELLGLFPFYVTLPEYAARYLLATVVAGVPLAAVTSALIARTDSTEVAQPESELPRTRRLAFAAIPFVWGVSGFVGGVFFSIRERIDVTTFEEFGVEFLYHGVNPDIFGQGARRIQVVLGAVFLVAWLFTLRQPDTSVDSGERPGLLNVQNQHVQSDRGEAK